MATLSEEIAQFTIYQHFLIRPKLSRDHWGRIIQVWLPGWHSYRPRSEGDNVLGSVRPSVRLFVCALLSEPFDLQSVCLCACNQWAYADNRADAVDWLLIFWGTITLSGINDSLHISKTHFSKQAEFFFAECIVYVHWEKKESQNGSPTLSVVWQWVAIFNMCQRPGFLVNMRGEKEAFFPQTWLWRKKRLSSTKESRFSKFLSKRAILALFFSQCSDVTTR